MGDESNPVDFETREVHAKPKAQLTVYDKQLIDVLEGRAEMEGEPQSIEYSCGHLLVQSDRKVTPAACPHCGGPLYG